MIVGSDWIWLHFPKCGGTSAQALLKKNFSNDNSVQFDKLDQDNVIWHENIPQRQSRLPEFSVDGKKIVVIFRRLPDWLLSRVHYEASRPPHHTVTREQLCRGQFLENSGVLNSAEAVFNRFNNPPVDTWVKVESIHDDFEKFFGKRLEPLGRRLNENKFGYIRDHSFWFTKTDLEEMYQASPNWAAAEKAVYGDLLA
ncbi:hypothetical protein [Falsiphaeobacter marinintestinus]|uniref:hypothetical protein n=1 Tax=Falsiphaeobacter marinintestinus TaxID=1492905 RepID=UPI0011B7C2E7|nr:hypothetical protein [Phaeobacter marinintestinus]